MKILVDTNVLLDVLIGRKPFLDASEKVFKLCEVKKIDGYVSALSVANLVYVMRKELDAARIRELLARISLIFAVADLKTDDLHKASEFPFGDYEDALQSVTASRIGADYIVTRNIKDFVGSDPPAVKPEELLERI